MNPIIESENIHFGYTESRKILNDISFRIYEGQLITLLGPNGVGKSTLLNCICGLLKPSSGMVKLFGNPISKLSRREIAQQIAYVPQKSSVSFDYSVKDFVVMGRSAYLSILATPSEQDYKKTDEALEKLGITQLRERPISELSGGEQQKACIARAIVQDPKLVILDEPTSALDYGNQVKVLRLIKELSASGYAVLMTTHNPDHSFMLNGDVAIMSHDGKMEMGAVDQILTENRLEEAYGTKIRLMYVDEMKRKICVPVGL